MNIPYFKKATMISGVKLLLATASPFQQLFDKPGTPHEFCNRQALTIFSRDGFEVPAHFLSQYTAELNEGVYWADKGWKNISHYWVPGSDKGLWQFDSAFTDFKYYYLSSLRLARHGDYRKSIFLLGAAAHLVQDLCVPHHARGRVFDGHREYEAWAQRHYSNYAVNNTGIYLEDKKAEALLWHNAIAAGDLLSWVQHSDTPSYYHVATELLLPMAQRSTAGLFLHYTKAITQNGCKLIDIEKAAAKLTSQVATA